MITCSLSLSLSLSSSSRSLKWYKDGLEFYSYVPKMAAAPKRFFPVQGLQVDVSLERKLNKFALWS